MWALEHSVNANRLFVDHGQILLTLQFLYAIGLGLIKCSIMLTMISIFWVNRTFRILGYHVLMHSAAWVLMTILIGLLLCHPLEASWNPLEENRRCGHQKCSIRCRRSYRYYHRLHNLTAIHAAHMATTAADRMQGWSCDSFGSRSVVCPRLCNTRALADFSSALLPWQSLELLRLWRLIFKTSPTTLTISCGYCSNT